MWFEIYAYCMNILLYIVFFGGLGLAFTLPLWIAAFRIRKEMKTGKSFKEAWKEVHKNSGRYQHQFPTHSSSSSSISQLQDMNTSSSYVGLPNNIFTSK